MHIPYNPKLRDRARKMRKNPTPAEQFFWEELLADDKTGFRFLRQKPIDQYIVDFYCSQLGLVIEIDGQIHKQQEEYDAIRSLIFTDGYDLTVLRFTNEEVLQNLEHVEEVLTSEIQKLKTVLHSPS